MAKNDSEELLNLISDFVKGKIGKPDINMAKITWNGKPPKKLPAPIDTNPNFKSIADQYPLIKKSLKNFSGFHTAVICGSLLTLPELQGNSIRLLALSHLAVRFGKGNKPPTAANISTWFNQMDKGICGRLEDAAEDVFIGNVYDSTGNYRIFQGTAEATAFHVQIMLNILETMPSVEWANQLRNSVHSLLKISDLIAERAELDRNIVVEPTPRSQIPVLELDVFNKIKGRTVFTKEELLAHNINIQDLSPFIFDKKSREQIDNSVSGNSILETYPILMSGEKICVTLPNEIGISIRKLIINTCLNYGMKDAFESVQAKVYGSIFSHEALFDQYRNAPLMFTKLNNIHVCSVAKEVDKGRYINFMFFCDNLNGYHSNSFAGRNSGKEPTDFIEKAAKQTQKELSQRDNFREAITLVIPCGWGRKMQFNLPQDSKKWRFTHLSPYDLLTISRKHDFKALDLFRILDAERAISNQGIILINLSGLLNLYAWMMENKGHIVPHEKLESDFCGNDKEAFLNIPLNSILSLRYEVLKGADVHSIQSLSGKYLTVRRSSSEPRYGSKELSPFYMDINALDDNVFRSVFQRNKSKIWVEIPASEGTDRLTMYHLAKMILHWAERISDYITKNTIVSQAEFLWRVVFEDVSIPLHSEKMLDDDETRRLINYTTDQSTRSVSIIIKKGFLAASRRVDNLAEKEVVRNLVTSCCEINLLNTTKDEIDKMVNNIVPDIGARHFHVFTENDVRNYVRDSLPSEGQIILLLDDTESKIGLGWTARERSKGDKIEGKEDCCNYLSDLVKAIGNNIKEELKQYNRHDVINTLLLNHEALFVECDQWIKTFKAVIATSDDPTHATKQAGIKLAQFNAGTMASRIIIEIALCHSPIEGGLKAGKRDIGKLMAAASQLFHFGGYSDAMIFGVMDSSIRISPAGDILMTHDFSDKTVRPLGEKVQHNMLSEAAKNYQKNYVDETKDEIEQEINSVDEDFIKAWNDEFEFSVDDLGKIIMFFKEIIMELRQPILEIKKSDLVTKIEEQTKLSQDTIIKVLDIFTLKTRAKWDEAPEEFLSNSWHPWRFRRQLSLVSRPLIQLNLEDDPTFIICPTMIVHHTTKFLSDVRFGLLDKAFFKKKGSLYKWVGRMGDEIGKKFNERVQKEFINNGWHADVNLSDGKILNRKSDDRFGDVDVLAWKPETGEVIVVECKDLSLDKTFGEMAKRLTQYRGIINKDGKRDSLKRHLDRYDILKQNKEALEKYTKCNIKSIKSVLVFSGHTPMHFDQVIKDLGVETLCVNEINLLNTHS